MFNLRKKDCNPLQHSKYALRSLFIHFYNLYCFMTNAISLTSVSFKTILCIPFECMYETTKLSNIPTTRTTKKKPWPITADICKQRFMLKSLFLSGNDLEKRKFRRPLNKLIKTTAFSKKGYFTEIMDKNKRNIKKTWQMRSSSYYQQTSCKIINKQNDPKTEAILLILFFYTIGKKLADKILDADNHAFLNYPSKCQSIYVKLPELNEIINSIHSLSVNIAIGHVNIPVSSLKIAATAIAPICNAFLTFVYPQRFFLKRYACESYPDT